MKLRAQPEPAKLAPRGLLRAAARKSADLVGMQGYGTQAARSTIRRYPSAIKRTLTPAPGARWKFDEGALAQMRRAPLAATWLGHASVLLRVGDAWVLTDPVFSQKIGVRVAGLTFGVSRLAPAVDIASLPTPDIIVLSHAHFDHFDKPTLRALANRTTHVVTARNTARLLPRGFHNIHELDWDQEAQIRGVHIRAAKPKHWGARTLLDRHRGFNAYALAHEGVGNVLFAGDTAYTDTFRALGPMDLSIFGIGAYDPWIHAHASPEEVWQMHDALGSTALMPVHHSTFELSDEPLHEPLERLHKAAGDKAPSAIVARDLGSVWTKP